MTLVGAGFVNSGTLVAQGTETLDGATVSGGIITDSGSIVVTGNGGEIESATVNGGNLTASAGTLTLAGDTLDGVTLVGAGFVNSGTLVAQGTETLDGATVSGGIITDSGSIVVTGNGGEIESATVNGGNLTASAGTLTLAGDTLDGVTLVGADFVNSGTLVAQGTETLDGATVSGGIIDDYSTNSSGGIVASDIDVTGDSSISGAGITDGDVTVASGVTLTLDNDTLTDATLDLDTDAVIQIDGSTTLTLAGGSITGGAIEAATGYTFSNSPVIPTLTGVAPFSDNVVAINSAGQVLGQFSDSNNNNNTGYIYSNGSFTLLQDPQAATSGTLYGFAGTQAMGINSSGEVVGYYSAANSAFEGFLYNNGVYTTLSDPSYPASTAPFAINDSGVIAGEIFLSPTDTEGFVLSGGVYTILQDPYASTEYGTSVVAISNTDLVVGNYYDAQHQSHAFAYNVSTQTYSTLNIPLAVGGSTVTAISENGQFFAGDYVDASGKDNAFFFSHGTVTTIDDPSGVGGTFAEGVNDFGQVVGFYVDGSGGYHAFLYSDGVFSDLDDPAAVPGSGALAINDSGQIAGLYGDNEGDKDTFIAQADNDGVLDVTANASISDATLSGGTATIANSVTLTLDGAAVEDTTVANNGTVAIAGASTLSGSMMTGGALTVASGVTLTLDGVTLDNVAVTIASDGTTPSIKIDSGNTLIWAGASAFGGPGDSGTIVIDNNGQILHTGTLAVGFSTSIFEGSGTITENGGNSSSIANTLINEGNTFDGYGGFGNGTAGWTTLENDAGTIDADVSAVAFTIDTGNTATNAGTFEATNGATLEIESTVAGDTTIVDDTGGAVSAAASSEVLLSDATIGTSAAGSGGTITIDTGGSLEGISPGNGGDGVAEIENAIINNSGELVTGGTFTLDDDTVNGGILTGAQTGNNTINVDANDTLTLNDVTVVGGSGGTANADNSGTITLGTTLTLSGGPFTLALNNDGSEGTGTVALNGATIEAVTSGEILQNDANTISGTGQIGNGNGDLTVQNDADGNITAEGGTLKILASVDNAGTMTADSGAILNLAGAVSDTSGTGSTVIDAGGTVEIGAFDQQAVTFDGVGTLQINQGANLTGAIDGLAVGDIIDFANTTITSTAINGSTLTVTEASGQTLTYQVAGALSGNSFVIQSDGNNGDELVLAPTVLTVGVTTTAGDLGDQVGQMLAAQAIENTDDATVDYQWQISSNGGASWTDVSATTTGDYSNGTLASFLQLTAADQGDLVRAVASFTNGSGQLVTATAAAATAVTDVTPEITAPFTYALDDLSIEKTVSGSQLQIYNDTFTAPPPGSSEANGSLGRIPHPGQLLERRHRPQRPGGRDPVVDRGCARRGE